MRYIILLLLFTASLFSAETSKMQIVGNGQKVDNEFVDKKKLDSNMELCAGLQIMTDLVGLSFESDNGIVSIENKPGFYILYLSVDERKVRVLCSGFEPLDIILRNYSINLEKGYFWTIKITGDKKVGDIPVNIISNPAGATLFVDGIDKGISETLLLSNGKHKIKLEKSGYAIIENEITVNLQNTLFNYNLIEEDPAKLKISSEPAGASVYLDGTKIGITPLTKFYPPGNYKIKIEKESFETIEEQLFVKLPETVNHYSLTDNSAFLTINTSPKASVYINGEKIAILNNIKLAPQFVEIIVTMPKAKDINRKIMLKKGERQTIDLMPEVAVGKIQVAVTPDDADLTLIDEDGISYTAKGSNIFKNMPVGRYELTAKLNGYKTSKVSITLSQNQIESKELILDKGSDIPYGFVFVQGGKFLMGSNDGKDDERPVHSVTVSDFYISKYEVTQKEWIEIMGTNPSKFKGDNLPVENFSWNDCQEFIKKLNDKTGMKYRLPTEAEWEYAARGGNKSKNYKYSGSDNLSSVAWYSDNSDNKTQPVGTKQANELGLYDMSGNVWEWCSDWHGDYNFSLPQNDPIGAPSGSEHVFRGGSCNYSVTHCRVAFRTYFTFGYRFSHFGFRLVCTT